MTYDAWMDYYKRLCVTFGKPVNGEQGVAYFEALNGFPDLCVQQAVQRTVRESKHWPAAAQLVEFAREERARMGEPPQASCPECHGSIWVSGPPRHDFGNTYETVMKCPTCRPQTQQQRTA